MKPYMQSMNIALIARLVPLKMLWIHVCTSACSRLLQAFIQYNFLKGRQEIIIINKEVTFNNDHLCVNVYCL